MHKLLIILIIVMSLSGYAQDNNTPVSFTLGDRDRLMRNEQKIENVHIEVNTLRTEMNVRFESIENKLDSRFNSFENEINELEKRMDIKFESQQKQTNIIITLMFFLLGGMMSLMGFVIYNRKTAIKPLQNRQEVLEKILVNYSKDNKAFREILKNAGLL